MSFRSRIRVAYSLLFENIRGSVKIDLGYSGLPRLLAVGAARRRPQVGRRALDPGSVRFGVTVAHAGLGYGSFGWFGIMVALSGLGLR